MICKGLDGIEIVHIDLSYNSISDSGAECLAECLKVCTHRPPRIEMEKWSDSMRCVCHASRVHTANFFGTKFPNFMQSH